MFLVTGSYWQVIKRSQVVSGVGVSMNHRNMLVSGPHGHQAPHTATCLTFLAGEIMTGASTVNCPAAGVDNDRDIGNLLNLSYVL